VLRKVQKKTEEQENQGYETKRTLTKAATENGTGFPVCDPLCFSLSKSRVSLSQQIGIQVTPTHGGMDIPPSPKKKRKAVGQNNKFVQVNRVILIYVISCGFSCGFLQMRPVVWFNHPPGKSLGFSPRPFLPAQLMTQQGFDPLIILLVCCKYYDLIDSISFHFVFSPTLLV